MDPNDAPFDLCLGGVFLNPNVTAVTANDGPTSLDYGHRLKKGSMKLFALFLALSLNAARLLAQAAPQNSPPPPHHQMGDHATAMHHHMQMQEQVTKMRSTLDKMKANVGTISDPASREHAQLDLELWESMVQHMEDMVKMMSMGGTGMKEGADHSRMEMKETPQTPE